MSVDIPVLRRFVWLFSALWMLAAVPSSRADTLVYSNDFEAPVGAEWSNPLISTTPSGRDFLGEFGWESVVLSLSDLPPHESVSLAFDLFVLKSWDGVWDDTVGEFERWSCDVVGGPTLIHTAFSQTGTTQAYTAVPTETNSLQYAYYGDAIYRVSVNFPHSDGEVQMKFSGFGLQNTDDESWGIDNIAVATGASTAAVPPPMPGPPAQVQAVAGVQSAAVSWTPPDPSGAGIERYSLNTKPNPWGPSYHATATVAAGLPEMTVSDLPTGGKVYRFRVAAIDTAGNISVSDWSTPVIPFWELLPGVNQLTNGDFESGELLPWRKHGVADRVIDPANPYEGSASLYLRSHAVGTWYADAGVHYSLPGFRAGQQYTFSAFMRAEAPRRVNMRASLRDASAHWNPVGERHLDVGTEWREYYIQFTPETDVVPARLAINAAESATGVWVDDVRFYEGPYQPTGPEPALAIVAPAVHYAAVNSASSIVEVGVHNHTGGWRWRLDDPFPDSGPAGGTLVPSGNIADLTGLMDVGAHTFYATLVDGSGDILQPPVEASTQLSVHGGTPFVLHEHTRVNDAGYIVSWLHLTAPIMTDVDALTALTRDTIGPETVVLATEGSAVPMGVDGAARAWSRINFDDMATMAGVPPIPYYLLDNIAWRYHELSSDFLVTYLRWDTSGVVDFSFVADDAGEAYLNGNRLYWSPSGDTASARVVAGEWNVLVAGTHESFGGWRFYAHANPVPDAIDNTGQYAHLVDLGTPVEFVAPQRVSPGSVFPASVRIAADVTSLDAASVELSIGPDANLEFDHVEVDGTLFDGAGVTVNAIDDTQITFVVNQSGGAGVSGPGEIARVYFRAVGPVDAVGSVAMASAKLSSVQAESIRSHVASGTSVVSLSCEPGDSNGDQVVDVVDITKIERIVAGLDPAPMNACPDANLDGVTNVLDVTSTERIVVGLPAVASAPMAARVPDVMIRPLQSDGGYIFDLVLEQSVDMVDTVYLELRYPEGSYAAAEIETFSLPSDATLLTNSQPGRTRHVRNVRGLAGVTLPEVVARVRLQESTPGVAPPVTLRVLIGDTSGRALVSRDFHIPMMRVPSVTTALPNFPNPFNPETWIPFDLAESADVVIRVYGVGGALVRTLDLGGLPPGSYADRSRAAYWDGRNESGEPVAGGVYHYELRAGDHRATRRMVILK
jgi:hypothetical protein